MADVNVISLLLVKNALQTFQVSIKAISEKTLDSCALFLATGKKEIEKFAAEMSELAKIIADDKDKINAMHERISELGKKIADTDSKIASVKSEIQSLNGRLRSLQGECSNFENRLRCCQDEDSARMIQHQLSNTRANIAATSRNIEVSKATLAVLEREKKILENQYDEAKANLAKLEAILSEHEAKYRRMENKYNRLTQLYRQTYGSGSSLSESLKRLTAETSSGVASNSGTIDQCIQAIQAYENG